MGDVSKAKIGLGARKKKQVKFLLLQDLALRRLWIAKIHHFIHELIDNDEVIPNTFFLEFFEIFHENLGEAMEEQDDFCGICIAS